MRLLLLAVLLSACTRPPERVVERSDLQAHYDSAGVRGGFILFDAATGSYLIYDAERVNRRYIPASTYKILNSLIALETGVVRDEKEVFQWDGVDRGWEMWNRDHDLRSAFRYSAVWFYQKLARSIGETRMREYVAAVDYGNEDTGGGIDQFWLTGELRISPREQVDFLHRLRAGDLPFSDRSMEIVRDIMILEEGDDYVLRGKTGWAGEVGWFVGYLEREGRVYFFANNIDIEEDADAEARVGITRSILMDLKLLR